MLDRLTHHVHILTMNGDSRLKQSSGRLHVAAAKAEQCQTNADTGDPDTGDPNTGETTEA